MDSKVIINLEHKHFELDLEMFDIEAKKEIFATFHNKHMKAEELLRLYLQKIQKEHMQNAQIQNILKKITL
ncbi:MULTISPECIES: hypothetical protein [unclassified Helicobacter]|uniref:hypothetical protein n=1 Tax=unclassified Helicobacter TaxID=2593540 RepID=UPI000CF1052E|nr:MULTISPECIES: hypothetical protein [unclassified Helicobacter]